MENGIFDIIKTISDIKKINISELPTQGLFYPKDFSLCIKKASFEDILEYNFNYIENDISAIIFETKKIIKKKIITNYTFKHIKSSDVLYIFFEIVKFTMDKEINIQYIHNTNMK